MINSFAGEYAFLSNFYPSPISIVEDENEVFVAKTVEHYFQYMKTPSTEEGQLILSASTPGEAKRLGRRCFLREDWNEVKNQVMLNALRKKFSNPELKQKLLDTGEEFLVEGNHWNDTYWGVCEGIGRNMLGTLLMQVREELKNETNS